MYQETPAGILIKIKVTPKAAKSEIVKWEEGELKIRIAAPPEKGAANKELIRFLANHLALSKSDIELVQGATSRHKVVCVKRIHLKELKSKLSTSLELDLFDRS